MLTHPAWLVAHAKNTETDPIRRGEWIQEKLLAGSIPDVPVTVDAVIPEDRHKTLRQRPRRQDQRWVLLGLPPEDESLGAAF